MENKLFTVKEVANRYSVTEKTVRRWANTGILKSIKIGKEHRFYKTDLENFERVNYEKTNIESN